MSLLFVSKVATAALLPVALIASAAVSANGAPRVSTWLMLGSSLSFASSVERTDPRSVPVT